MKDSSLRWTVCGATAGLCVDLGLFPLDTVKTRLQSKAGFIASGGLRNIYSGMGSVAIGSAPGAALFFLTYGTMKKILNNDSALVHATAASVGEVVACVIRVPTELIKQRAQASATQKLSSIALEINRSHGIIGFYRGFASTVAREIPFSVLQYPMWEYFKRKVSKEGVCTPLQGASCGSLAGGISAALTTPLDVAKTRIMLSKTSVIPSVPNMLQQVYSEGGVKLLFSGVTPRVLWMAIGGFVYFGAYETAMTVTQWAFP